MALALVIVYRATGRLNLAQGEMATVGVYVSLVLNSPATPFLAGTGLAANLPQTPWPMALAVPAAMVLTAAAALVVERVLVRPVTRAGPTAGVGVTVALLLLVNASTQYFWKPIPRGYSLPFPNGAHDYVSIFGARLRYETIGTWLALFAVLVVLWTMLRYTKAGLAFRAVASNPTMSPLCGIRMNRVLSGSWALAAAVGTLVGCLFASRLILEPNMMLRLVVFSFAAAAIGGLNSLGGALVGGVVVGVAQSMLGGYVSFVGSPLSLPAVMLMMVIVLSTKPSGLFGLRGARSL